MGLPLAFPGCELPRKSRVLKKKKKKICFFPKFKFVYLPSKQKPLKETHWDRTAKKGFLSISFSLPCHALHLQVRAGLWDLLWLIRSFWAAANCAVLSLIPRQVYLLVCPGARLLAPRALPQLVSLSYRLPGCNFSLSCPSTMQRVGQEAPALVLPPCLCARGCACSTPSFIGLQKKWKRNKSKLQPGRVGK